jgi:mono/diheme cytochrome c family protein
MTATPSIKGSLRLLPVLFLSGFLAYPAMTQQTGQQGRAGPDSPPGTSALGATTEGFLADEGEEIYMTACAGCHQPQGQGAIGAGTYPPLSQNPVLEGSRYPAWIVVNGMGAMPSFADWLDDEQVVAVVDYIQTSFRNDYETTLTTETVADLRDEPVPQAE